MPFIWKENFQQQKVENHWLAANFTSSLYLYDHASKWLCIIEDRQRMNLSFLEHCRTIHVENINTFINEALRIKNHFTLHECFSIFNTWLGFHFNYSRALKFWEKSSFIHKRRESTEMTNLINPMVQCMSESLKSTKLANFFRLKLYKSPFSQTLALLLQKWSNLKY